MKTAYLALAAALTLGFVSTANAQSNPYQDPDKCIAEIGALDANNDGYVDNDEFPTDDKIQTNVDTDGDGRVSGDELTVACNNSLVEALKPGR